jgi:DNA-binding MarR family transcriptional regulator
MDFDRRTSAGYLVNQMARIFARDLDDRLQELGLRVGAFPALLLLWEREGRTQRELVDLLDIEQPTMAATLTRMERDGLISRQKDQSDARVQLIWLTEKGRDLRGPAIAAANRVNQHALSSLDASEIAQFITYMTRVIEAQHTPPAK